MKIFLTFDIEIWCNGWDSLDERFPMAFDRYIYGRSKVGEYALPKTLEIMQRHGLKGVFFVEPLFAARFGVEYLAKIVNLIKGAGQEIQLHLHPEWTNEIRPAIFPDKPYKRQHLIHYSRDEQVDLVARGLQLLRDAGVKEINAFRAGSFAANGDTLDALKACGLGIDASLNMCYSISGADVRTEGDFYFPRMRNGLQLIPMSVFRDGFGRLRHAQVGACSTKEFIQAIEASHEHNHPCFTILSHNFEMLRVGSVERDSIVAGRFEALCQFLGRNSKFLPTEGFSAALCINAPGFHELVSVGRRATIERYIGQLLRRAGL